ncbi:hypothetical protein E3N88_26573 [Mikania micrantha]|uniref:Uncharacterized protein n=1 Tax=Mikania micrantha TaxID=192012 RepID=A0A5N6MX82_9ASTR|nr:hypothetical protein E3N88_26573 [Mikania micrantha]
MPDVMQWFEAFFEGDLAIKNTSSYGNSKLHIAVAIRRLRATKAKAGANAKLLSEAFFNVELIELHAELQRNSKDIISKTNESDGNTILHMAVGACCNDKVGAILSYIDDDDPDSLTKIQNVKGSTVLHIAAIVGNTKAAELLLKKNKNLLSIKDNEGKTPLTKAYENMRLDTTLSLLYASIPKDVESKENADQQISKSYMSDEDFHTCIDVLVQAILAKKYENDALKIKE